MMRDSCRAFVNDFVTPFIRQNWQREWSMDPDARLPRSILEQADKIGIRTLGVPEEFGGVALDPAHEVQTFALISEEIARGDSGLSDKLVQIWKVSVLLRNVAPRHLQELWFPRIVKDPGFLLAHCLTEPRGASDRWLPYNVPEAAMQTRAVLKGDEWVINGRKQFISNGYDASLFVVYANTNPKVGMLQGTSSFLVPRGTPGLTIARCNETLGGRFMNNGELVFEDMRGSAPGARPARADRDPAAHPRPHRGGRHARDRLIFSAQMARQRNISERERSFAMKPTLVTGANGHVGNNLCRQLVARGERVRAMIRASADPAPLAGLDVEIVRGDILDAGATASAVEGCGRVYHTAAGFLMWARDPERDIILPSVAGTRNVMEAAARAGVEKVVYTSSSGTIGHDGSVERPLDETHSNTEPHTHYLRGKIAAEHEAFAIARRTGLAMTSIHPGLILGPRFWKPSESVAQIVQFVNQGAPVYFDGGFSVVDVDDVARGAIVAMERGRTGERYILAGRERHGEAALRPDGRADGSQGAVH